MGGDTFGRTLLGIRACWNKPFFLADGGPRCFLPRTSFKSADGDRITAAMLQRTGGDVLFGPQESRLRVLDSKQLPATEQAIIYIQTAGSPYTSVADLIMF